MKLAVVGSRHFTDYKMMSEVLSKIKNITLIVSGGNRTFDHYNNRYMGADYFAEVFATVNNIPLLVHPANWYTEGRLDKSAGFKRNIKIVKDCDQLIAFWDGESKGTGHSIQEAKKANKKVTIVTFGSTK